MFSSQPLLRGSQPMDNLVIHYIIQFTFNFNAWIIHPTRGANPSVRRSVSCITYPDTTTSPCLSGFDPQSWIFCCPQPLSPSSFLSLLPMFVSFARPTLTTGGTRNNDMGCTLGLSSFSSSFSVFFSSARTTTLCVCTRHELQRRNGALRLLVAVRLDQGTMQ